MLMSFSNFSDETPRRCLAGCVYSEIINHYTFLRVGQCNKLNEVNSKLHWEVQGLHNKTVVLCAFKRSKTGYCVVVNISLHGNNHGESR